MQMLSIKTFILEFTSTLRSRDELNPKLWQGDSLRPEVREKLLTFARAFAEHCHVSWDLVRDVVLVGGSAGYNWTDQSDIDVHLMVDRASLGSPDLIDSYLQDKKKTWSLTHHVTVRGQPLEGYVQDPSEHSPVGQGVYSLERDEWTSRPEHNTHSWTTDEAFASKVENYVALIDHMIDTNAPLEDFRRLKSRMSDMRGIGLRQGGEYAPENQLFKELRNIGYLDKMNKYVGDRFDRELSLN